MTFEELIASGFDVDAIPPGTTVILRCRVPMTPEQTKLIAEQASAVAKHLGIKMAIVSPDLDVIPVPAPPAVGDVNGNPEQEEIRR